MVVKDQIGRKRYILCSIDGLEKRELLKNLRENNITVKIVLHNNRYCVLRCSHDKKDEIITLLDNPALKDKGIKSIKTSGTIKKLKRYMDIVNTF